ncbi:MAG: hypothetical protein QXY18_01070 [Nitrososphaerota archaeon]
MSIQKIANVPVSQISKFQNINISNISKTFGVSITPPSNPIELFRVKTFDFSNIFGPSYSRWSTFYTNRHRYIGFSVYTIPEGYTNAKHVIYDILNDEYVILNTVFNSYYSATEDENKFYIGVYDFPSGGTQAGLVVFDKNNRTENSYLFGYHIFPCAQQTGNFRYVFAGDPHGQSHILRYLDKQDNQIKNLTIFNWTNNMSASYYTFNNKFLVSSLSYYFNQTSSEIKMIDANTLEITPLGTISGASSVGNFHFIYKDKLYIAAPGNGIIYECNNSLQILNTYSFDSTFDNFTISSCFPFNENDSEGEPILILSQSFGYPGIFKFFNLETKQTKTLNLSEVLPARNNFIYFPYHKKNYFVVFAACNASIQENVKVYIFKINRPTLWEAL